jgi:hypothetical protein
MDARVLPVWFSSVLIPVFLAVSARFLLHVGSPVLYQVRTCHCWPVVWQCVHPVLFVEAGKLGQALGSVQCGLHVPG